MYHFLQSNYRQLLFNLKKIKSKLHYAKYKGSGLECNVCGALYTKFIDELPSKENKNALLINNVVAGYGQNILCPNCLSTARERLILALLKNKIKLSNCRILHFSPEKNIFNYLKQYNEIITADLAPLFYKHIDNKITQEDATQLSYTNEFFDVVIANHILEHIPNDIKAMEEIYRVLKKGGKAILQVPFSASIANTLEDVENNNPQKQSALFGQKDHVRIYQFQNYLERLKSCGFIVNELTYTDLSAFYKNAIQINESFIEIEK